MLVFLQYHSRHGKVMRSGISSGDVMIKLTFDVSEKTGGANSKKMRLRPLHAQLFLHQNQPQYGVLGNANASSRLKPNFKSSLLKVFTNSATHDDADGKDCVHAFLSS